MLVRHAVFCVSVRVDATFATILSCKTGLVKKKGKHEKGNLQAKEIDAKAHTHTHPRPLTFTVRQYASRAQVTQRGAPAS